MNTQDLGIPGTIYCPPLDYVIKYNYVMTNCTDVSKGVSIHAKLSPRRRRGFEIRYPYLKITILRSVNSDSDLFDKIVTPESPSSRSVVGPVHRTHRTTETGIWGTERDRISNQGRDP